MGKDISITIERYSLPLGTINVFINNENHLLKLGKKLNLKLPNSGRYDIVVSHFIYKKEMSLILKDKQTLKIKHFLPEWYYLISIFLGIILGVLTFLNIISLIYLTTFILLFYIPIIYLTFINRKKFFQLQII